MQSAIQAEDFRTFSARMLRAFTEPRFQDAPDFGEFPTDPHLNVCGPRRREDQSNGFSWSLVVDTKRLSNNIQMVARACWMISAKSAGNEELSLVWTFKDGSEPHAY